MKIYILISASLLFAFQCKSFETIQVSKNDRNVYRAYTEHGFPIKNSGVEHCKYDPKTDIVDQCKKIRVNFGF